MISFLSWLAFVLTVTSVLLCTFKRKSTWLVGLAAGVVWAVYACLTHQPALLFCQFVFIPLDIYGYYKWTKEEKWNTK
jgi:nicotinamide riboside transporter PnuC